MNKWIDLKISKIIINIFHPNLTIENPKLGLNIVVQNKSLIINHREKLGGNGLVV